MKKLLVCLLLLIFLGSGARDAAKDPKLDLSTLQRLIHPASIRASFEKSVLPPRFLARLWAPKNKKNDQGKIRHGWYGETTGDIFFYFEGERYHGWLGKASAENPYGEKLILQNTSSFPRGEKTYFDKSGRMKRGWATYKAGRLYFDRWGQPLVGWQDIGKDRFFFDDRGLMLRGWKDSDRGRYYLSDEGSMTRGWKKILGFWYFFDEEGRMQTGWSQEDRYYFHDDGRMAEGLTWIEGKKYYFMPERSRAEENWSFFDDQWCRTESLQRFTQGRWEAIEGNFFRGLPSSEGRARGRIRLGKEDYYFSPSQGEMESSKWLEQEGAYYYLSASGKMVKGLCSVDGVKYFFNERSGILEIDGSKPIMALTFDDGPGNYTPELLDILRENEAKASFFLIGIQIPGMEGLVKRMAEEGHSLGNHSYSHPHFTSLSEDQMRWQVEQTDELIFGAAGVRTDYFRPPGGFINSHIASFIGKKVVLWNVDTRDWQHRNSATVLQEMLSHARDGAIILMHDIYPSTLEAVRYGLPELRKQGYQLLNLDDFFSMMEDSPEEDKVYLRKN